MKRLLLGFALATAIAAACSSSDDGAPPPLGNDAGGGGTSGGPGPTTDGGDGATGADGDIPDTYVPPPPVYVNSTHLTTPYGGQTRLYDLSIPVDYSAAKSYPLVLVFHGNPGTADGMLAGAPFDPISKTNAIVAYPNALADGDWNFTLSSDNPDFGFTAALVDLLAGQYNIDKTKVYGVGFSGGGFFVNMLSCTMPGVLRAFAAHAGGAPYDGLGGDGNYPNTSYIKCSASEAPVAALIVHGMDDNVVEYGSGTYESQYWGFVNGCSDDTTATTPSPCVTHNNCPAATPVEFCGVPGLGHGIWAQGYATSWDFFQALP